MCVTANPLSHLYEDYHDDDDNEDYHDDDDEKYHDYDDEDYHYDD